MYISCPTSCSKQAQEKVRQVAQEHFFNMVLKISRNRNCITSPSKFFQCLMVLMVVKTSLYPVRTFCVSVCACCLSSFCCAWMWRTWLYLSNKVFAYFGRLLLDFLFSRFFTGQVLQLCNYFSGPLLNLLLFFNNLEGSKNRYSYFNAILKNCISARYSHNSRGLSAFIQSYKYNLNDKYFQIIECIKNQYQSQ